MVTIPLTFLGQEAISGNPKVGIGRAEMLGGGLFPAMFLGALSLQSELPEGNKSGIENPELPPAETPDKRLPGAAEQQTLPDAAKTEHLDIPAQPEAQDKPNAPAEQNAQSLPKDLTERAMHGQPESQTKLATHVQPEPQTRLATHVQPEAQTKLATHAQPETHAKPTTHVQPEAQIKPATHAQPEAHAKVTTHIQPKEQSQPTIHLRPEGQAKSTIHVLPELQSEPTIKAPLRVQAEPNLKIRPKIAAAPATQNKAQLAAERNVQTRSKPKAGPVPRIHLELPPNLNVGTHAVENSTLIQKTEHQAVLPEQHPKLEHQAGAKQHSTPEQRPKPDQLPKSEHQHKPEQQPTSDRQPKADQQPEKSKTQPKLRLLSATRDNSSHEAHPKAAAQQTPRGNPSQTQTSMLSRALPGGILPAESIEKLEAKKSLPASNSSGMPLAEGNVQPQATKAATAARQAMPAEWVQTALNQAQKTKQFSDGWKMVQVKLDNDEGTLTVRARRSQEGVSVTVTFSDPAMRALAQTHTDRILQTLQQHYDTNVDFSFMGERDSNGAGDPRGQEGRHNGTHDAIFAPPTNAETESTRAYDHTGRRQWIG